MGQLASMEANGWQSRIEYDATGLEIQRELSGGVQVHTQRDCFGRVNHQSVKTRNIEQSRKRYNWSQGNQLKSLINEFTGNRVDFEYDAWDNLVSAEHSHRKELTTVYKCPDAIGNLFETPQQKDRKYKSSQLQYDGKWYYYYDGEGNLVQKSPNQWYDRKKPQEWHTGCWQYQWNANGSLQSVTRPDGRTIAFKYDALGRRVSKRYRNRETVFVWSGNVPLHELHQEDNTTQEVITWLFEGFVPVAKIVDDQKYSIVSDYLGTPTHAFNVEGEKVWERELDIYGRAKKGTNDFVPFLYQGQYYDIEIGLAYNRFRYYSPETGSYISQDPIGLLGGMALYGYVHDTNGWIDVFGWHGNELTNVTDSILYDIKINGKQFKYGIADANRTIGRDILVVRPNGKITVIPKGTPVRLHQQLRKAYSNFDDVVVDKTLRKQVTTEFMRDLETKKIIKHIKKTGKVPSGNKDHARRGFGELADDFNGVHDLRKDLKMQNNIPKHH